MNCMRQGVTVASGVTVWVGAIVDVAAGCVGGAIVTVEAGSVGATVTVGTGPVGVNVGVKVSVGTEVVVGPGVGQPGRPLMVSWYMGQAAR